MISFILGLALTLAELSGIVRDPDGKPVPNAIVVISGATAAPISVRTDESGRFRITDLPDARVDIAASSPGLVGELRAVTADPGRELEITLRLSAIAESLVVSAAQIDQSLSRVADTVTIIDGREVSARQLSFLGDALASVPGLTVARSGGPGTLTSLFPRGGESDFTLVLVDGVRLNAFGGGLDLSQVPLGDVERIEVVRGPQSAVYGSDAIGGVVQIITRNGGQPSATGRLEAGGRNSRRFAGSTTGESAGWRWQAGGDYFAEDGFEGTAPASGEVVSNDDAEERQGWLGGGYRFRYGTDLRGAFHYVDTDRGAPGPFGSDPANRFSGVDRISRGSTERRAFGIRVVHPWGGAASRVRQRVDIDSADYDLSFLSAFNPLNPSQSETRRTHARVQTDASLASGISMSGGVEWLDEQGSSSFIRSGSAIAPIERQVVGAFGEARWAGAERVTAQIGVRAEHITRESLAVNGGLSSGDDSLTSVNPKIAAAWLVSRGTPSGGARAWTRLRASAGTGIRPPDVFEIAFTDNPALKPERSRSFEVGVTQALYGGAVSLDATTFFNEFDDLIISVGRLTDVSRYRTDNISNARTRGLELAAAWQAGAQANLRATYTYLDGEIRAVDNTSVAPTPYRVGDRLLRRPAHQGSVDFTWTTDRASLFTSLVARGETLDAEPAFGASGGLFENPGRAVVDLGGSWRIVRGIDVYARVTNLFDKEYEDVLGYPSPGRTAFAGVRLAAGR